MGILRSRKDGIDDFTAEVETRLAGAEEEAVAEPPPPPMIAGRAPIGELLRERGVVTEEDLREALAAQTVSGLRLGEILLNGGVVSESALASVLAEQLGLDTIELGQQTLDQSAADLLPPDVARQLCAVPVRRVGERVEFAVADPAIDDLMQNLIGHTQSPVRLLVATKSDVLAAIDRAYLDSEKIDDALREFEVRFGQRQRAADAHPTMTVDENAPVVRVVNMLFEQAVRDRASDLHIEPQETRVRIRVRTDGALHEIMSLPAAMAMPLVSRIKVMAGMNIVERRRAQDGQLEVSVLGRDLDVRVSTTATVWGEKCVLRLLDKTAAFLDLHDLGLSPDALVRYQQLIRSPHGMVICAGPTGAGKSTTLYATLAAIDSEERNVMTIEDPVEYLFSNINQIRINEQAGITFANGLRSILRQDPDAIMVGEIRDIETARIAVQAALTGHFVMSSLHATDAASALHRFMDMGIEPFLTASSLLGVLGQRLLRKICPHCTERYEPTPEEVAFYRELGGNARKRRFVHGAGCKICGSTGYYNRIGVYEVLTVSEAMKELVVANASLSTLRATAEEEGMRPLRSEAIALVDKDVTTIAEVYRTVYML